MRKTESNGFALILTIWMMVLLGGLVIGMLSLSTVAVRSSGRSAAKEAARNNARMALMIAIGNLQEAAGPDQRVTATADIASASGGDAATAGEMPQNDINIDGTPKGLSLVRPGTRYWTGVFSNRDNPDSIHTKTPAPRVERWLVSGDSTLTPDSSDCEVDANGSVTDPDKAVVLVGPNTLPDGSHGHFVAAPIVKVGGAIPGAYAWWIGDEGVKSRINIERGDDDGERYTSLVPQRRGWETVAGLENYPPPTNDADSKLPMAITVPTASLLLPEIRDIQPSSEAPLFHSITTSAMGLLTNSVDGGLRVDLTGLFEDGLPASAPSGNYDNYPVLGGRVIPQNAAPGLDKLKWDDLAEFYRQTDGLSSGKLTVTARSADDEVAIAPTIFDFRLLFGVDVDQEGDANEYNVHPCGKIAVTLANPYSVPLKWDQSIEIEVINMTPQGNAPSRIWGLWDVAFIGRSNSTINNGDDAISVMSRNSFEKAVFNKTTFRIAPGELPAGEARGYTVASRVVRPWATADQPVTVDLAPFSSSSPFDFNNCVEIDSPRKVSLPRTMDVRESYQTTLVGIEMRLQGSNGWLRRIGGFELDNGYFVPNTRRFTEENTEDLNGPVPIMLYSFQMSQPGMDYGSLMPAGYAMGQRSSTVRTFADFNIRATNIHANIASYNTPPYFMESNDSISQLPFDPGGLTGQGFTRNLVADPLYWGHSSVTGSNKVILFSVPDQFASLAQFQHADLTVDDFSRSVGHQPGNAFGNSYAPPFVSREQISDDRYDFILKGSPDRTGAFETARTYYDISHLLNTSLWDRYFFSTIVPATTTPENPALLLTSDSGAEGLDEPSQAAAELLVNGAFNINSTDENAWKALLASSRYFTHPAETDEFETATFPRSLDQSEPHSQPPTGERNDSFSGYRRLSDDELDTLATEIVRQVRLRGPFVSLSHFVNRALVPLSDDPVPGRSGALQQALDESGINISFDGDQNGFADLSPVEERVTMQMKEGAPRADLDGGDRAGQMRNKDSSEPDWAVTSRDNNFGTMASIVADREMLLEGSTPDETDKEQGYRSTGIPTWMTQADVLQAIGPVISPRSDTFRIRTCGQAHDAEGNVIATAYCEAIVQRSISYVDPSDEPHERGSDLSTFNQTYGRKFEIVSFRWLSPLEI